MTTGVRLATAADDAGLRALLRRSVVPGVVSVAFTREPSYDAGARLAGADEATVLLERGDMVAGMGRCSVRMLHRNGTPCRIGYLSELRTVPGTAAIGRAMRDGYRLLGEWAAGAGATAVVTSIATDNARARQVLEHGGRLGLPRYRPLCELVTLMVPVPRRVADRHGQPSAAPDELTAFLASHARDSHLTLPWAGETWRALAAHGVSPEGFVTVRDGGRVAAAAGVWDQRPFRQIVVSGVHGVLGLARPVVNLALKLAGRPHLPGPGEVLAHGAVVAPTVASERLWPALWSALLAQAARLGTSWLAVAFDRREPALAGLRQLLRPREYHTTLYGVATRGDTSLGSWDARLFRPEVGLL